MGKHAVLSASSSERWLNCPPSARLSEAYEDKSSDYAAEGSDAHALAEDRLKQATDIPTEDPVENLSWYNEEMEECAQGYAAYVVELLETAKQTCSDLVVMIEQRVDFSRWVKEGFGTADCIVIADGIMNICDLKLGKGIEVSAVGNPQMRLYALGALEIFDDIYDIEEIRMTIYQPRKGNISVDRVWQRLTYSGGQTLNCTKKLKWPMQDRASSIAVTGADSARRRQNAANVQKRTWLLHDMTSKHLLSWRTPRLPTFSAKSMPSLPGQMT